MIKIWQQLIYLFFIFQGEADVSRYKIIKTKSNLIISLKSTIRSVILITIGIFLRRLVSRILLTNKFIDGGATGISLLISAVTDYKIHYIIPIVNLPFIVMAYKMMVEISP